MVKTLQIIYLIFIAVLIFIKPKYIYNTNGNLKHFGTGHNKTIFPLWLLIFIGSFFSYYLSHLLIFIYVLKKN